MTEVIVQYTRPSPDGPVPVGGAQRWRPTRRRTANGTVIMPLPFRVEVPGTALANVTPTGADWAWRVDEFVEGTINTVYVMVPDLEQIYFSDLVQVDPDTFEALSPPEAAWYAYVNTLEAAASTAVTEAMAARAAAEVAQLAATDAETGALASALAADTSASEASASAATASINADFSGDSAAAANASASQALGSANTAAARSTDATNAANDAGAYAANASALADTAAQRAFEANQSAAFAQERADFAEAVANGFGIGTVGTTTPGSAATADISGVGVHRKLNLQLPQGFTGPPLTAVVVDTVTGPETPGATGSQGLKGDKGDPGGITLGTQLFSMSDLNLITTAGVYRQVSGSSSTYNYPTPGKGTAVVHVVTEGTLLWQEWTPDDTGTFAARVFYRRKLVGTVWSPWYAYTSTRVSESAGRVIYAWDDLNNREQLVYGDTGWRNCDALKIAGVENAPETPLSLRREGSTVWMTYAGYIQSSDPLFIIPSGFRPQAAYERKLGTKNLGATDPLITNTLVHTENLPSWDATQANAMKIFENWRRPITTSTRLSISINWNTADPWPTTLPGTAIGTIPNV